MEDRPWHRHYDPGIEPSYRYPDVTLPQLLRGTTDRYPDRVVTIFKGKELSYRDLMRQADAFAGALHALGIRPGERVAIMLPNLPQFVVAYFGALAAGAVVVPTNPLYTSTELAHQLEDAGASAIVTLDLLFPVVQAALPAMSVRAVIVTSVAEALPQLLRPLYGLKMRRGGHRPVRSGGVVHRFKDLVRAEIRPPEVELHPHDLAVLQYTGGTTGSSKGAMLTHRNLVCNAIQAYHWQGEVADDTMRILCAAPFFHVYGMTIGMTLGVVAGGTLLLIPRWIPEDVAKVAERYKPQLFPGVPTMYISLTRLPGFSARQFGSLRTCLSGAAPLPPDVQRQFREVCGAELVEGYGLTEASPVTHCNPVSRPRTGTVGIPFPDTDAIITDPETWEPLPPNTVGEMTVAGPQVMQGYWNRPEETASVLRDGWLHTGDMATMDEEGYFRIVDRKKDMIITGGYNVYPREVEDVLYSHPRVKEAAVIGVDSEYRGETVKAFIVPEDGEHADEDDIVGFCRLHLAAYKVPKIVEFRAELPKNLIGKVLRRTLREEETRLGLEPANVDVEQPIG